MHVKVRLLSGGVVAVVATVAGVLQPLLLVHRLDVPVQRVGLACRESTEKLKMLGGKSREVGMWQMALWDCTLK